VWLSNHLDSYFDDQPVCMFLQAGSLNEAFHHVAMPKKRAVRLVVGRLFIEDDARYETLLAVDLTTV
jgi:hypothetical protein